MAREKKSEPQTPKNEWDGMVDGMGFENKKFTKAQ